MTGVLVHCDAEQSNQPWLPVTLTVFSIAVTFIGLQHDMSFAPLWSWYEQSARPTSIIPLLVDA